MKPELNILHLEDSENDGLLISALLRQQGIACQIERVQTRERFLAALERGECDLILSDFTLPGFNGLAALALANEKRPGVPFIFVSGTLGEEVAIDSLKRGATDYVLKDRPSRLGAAVRRAVEDADEHRALARAEEAMVQSEFKYRQLFECLSEAAILSDAKSGRVLDANKQAELLLGRTRGEIIGLNRSQFLSPAAQEEFNKRFSGADSQNERVEIVGEVLSKDGAAVPVTISAGPLVLYKRKLILALYHQRVAK